MICFEFLPLHGPPHLYLFSVLTDIIRNPKTNNNWRLWTPLEITASDGPYQVFHITRVLYHKGGVLGIVSMRKVLKCLKSKFLHPTTETVPIPQPFVNLLNIYNTASLWMHHTRLCVEVMTAVAGPPGGRSAAVR